MNDKIETYIGFAIKKGSVAFGCDGIERCRKRIYLIVATETLSQNSLDALRKGANGCEIIITKDYNNLKQKNCKALAICDESLAKAIAEANQRKSEETNGKHN